MEQKKISVLTAILMNANIMIGAGIFIGPTMMAQKAGNLSFLGWFAVAIVFLPVVWSVTQVSQYFPRSNTFYSYSQSLGSTATFITAWTYFIGYISIIPIQLIGFSEVIHSQFKLEFPKQHPVIFYGITIAALALLNLISLEKVSKLQNTLTILKLIPILFVIFISFFYWNPNLQIDLSNISTLKLTLPLALFGYLGFESCSNMSNSIKGGRKGVSVAILTAFLGIALIYSLFHFGILHIMGQEKLATLGVPAFVYFLNIKSAASLNLLNAVLSSIIALCYVSSAYGIFVANSNVLHSMAKENLLLFSSKLKKTTKNNRPIIITIVKSIIIFLILVFVQNKIILTSFCNLGIIIAFLFTLVSLSKMQLKNKHLSQFPITLLAFGSNGLIIYYSWINMGANNIIRLQNLVPLMAIILIGIIMFKMQTKRTQKHIIKSKN